MTEYQTGAPACGREPLLDAVMTFLAQGYASNVREIRTSLEQAIDAAGPGAIESLSERLAHAGADWNYYPRDPLARRIHHVLARRVLQHLPEVLGTKHLQAAADKPLVIFANHLSYSDANVIEVVLQQVGAVRLADRLTVVAGPKVYSSIRRRFSSLCFGTIKVPQSAARSTDEAVMRPRDVARTARRSIQIAHERLRLGEALLVFPEGSRSRTGRMHQLLSGVVRYLDAANTWVMPVAIAGTEGLFPIDQESLTSVQVTVRIGRPVPASALHARARRDRRLMMDSIGFAIADLLPSDYRGVYGEAAAADENARRLATELFG
jgi:1-acyl-sn-glycerol-3-phosphate acyltransferase